MLPEQFSRFFWDTNLSDLDIAKNTFFIVERLLERGDTEAITWMLKTYSAAQVMKVLQKSRSLSRRSARFWSLYFDLNPVEVPCTQKSWPPKPSVVSTY